MTARTFPMMVLRSASRAKFVFAGSTTSSTESDGFLRRMESMERFAGYNKQPGAQRSARRYKGSRIFPQVEKDVLHYVFSLAGVFQNAQSHGVHQAPITVKEVGHCVVVASAHSLEKLLVFPPTEAGGIGARRTALGHANTQGRIVRGFIHQRVGMGRPLAPVAMRDLGKTQRF